MSDRLDAVKAKLSEEHASRVDRSRLAQWAARLVTGFATALVISVALAILALIVYRGAGAIDWEFLSQPPRMGMREGGIFPVIIGTALVTLGTALFALPTGILAGVYLSEYAHRGRATRIIRLAITNMAGVPSIVYGLFGLAVFVLLAGFGDSIVAAALTLAAMTLPVVITATEEALRQIPSDLRHASLALGATKWRTIRKVVLPAAGPGVITGSILGLARAAGETAPILFTGAVFFQPSLPDSPFSEFMALPYHVFILATSVPNPPENIIWGTAFVLVAMVSLVSISVAIWRSRQRRKIVW
jgi:phosphate transport system permease protein